MDDKTALEIATAATEIPIAIARAAACGGNWEVVRREIIRAALDASSEFFRRVALAAQEEPLRSVAPGVIVHRGGIVRRRDVVD